MEIKTIIKDYIIEKFTSETFKTTKESYKEDVYKLAELANIDMSTFVYKSRNDINKVFEMINPDECKSILKNFLIDYFLVKYDLSSDFKVFYTKEFMITYCRTAFKKIIWRYKIKNVADLFLSCKSLKKKDRKWLNNWIQIENDLISQHKASPRSETGHKYRKEFYSELFSRNIQRSVSLDNLRSIVNKCNINIKKGTISNQWCHFLKRR